MALDVFNPEGNWNADNKRYFCTWLAIVDWTCFPRECPFVVHGCLDVVDDVLFVSVYDQE